MYIPPIYDSTQMWMEALPMKQKKNTTFAHTACDCGVIQVSNVPENNDVNTVLLAKISTVACWQEPRAHCEHEISKYTTQLPIFTCSV